MNTTRLQHFYSWSTATAGDAPDTSTFDLAVLETHLMSCDAGRGRLFRARCVGDAVGAFIAPRVISGLAFVGALAVLAVLVL